MDSEGLIHAVYRVQGGAEYTERLARAIAWEQTVELPEGQVTDPAIRDGVVGRVEGIVPDPDQAGARRVHLAFPAALASGQIGQLFNLLYGNVSMYRGVRLVNAELPAAVLRAFAGPRYGAEGVRRLTGVYGRPLLATAVKPRGAPIERLVGIVRDFALGGGERSEERRVGKEC